MTAKFAFDQKRVLPPRPADDRERFATLSKAGLLHNDLRFLDSVLDRFAKTFNVNTATISLIGLYFQHIKASVGTNLFLSHRDDAFCAYTILEPEILVVSDARKDKRFQANPLVMGDPHIRFYAGVPLRIENGQAFGAFCLIGPEPREWTSEQSKLLIQAAAQINALLIQSGRLRQSEQTLS